MKINTSYKGIGESISEIDKVNNSGDLEDKKIQRFSEQTYQSIVRRIYGLSEKHLKEINKQKEDIRKPFIKFFKCFIMIQFIVIVGLVLLIGFSCIHVDKIVMVVFISSAFVETMGAIIVMVKFAFDTNDEKTVLHIISKIVENYQKYK